MSKWIVRVEQDFEIEAESFDEACRHLPSYGWSPNPKWQMIGETIELREQEGEGDV